MDAVAITALILKYKYSILFPLALIEGPVLSFVVGTLAGLGYFNPFLVYPILLAGDLIPDTFFYILGRKGKREKLIAKYGGKIGITDGHFEIIERIWLTHPRKTMLVSKLALGLSAPLLVSAGLADVRPKTFYSVAISVALVQHAILLTLGYHFGGAYGLVKEYIGGFEFFVLAVALFGIAYYLLSAYMKKKFLREEKSGML